MNDDILIVCLNFLFQVRDGMRFVEVVLSEPDKNVVALADAYFFPPFQPSLLPRSKGGVVYIMKRYDNGFIFKRITVAGDGKIWGGFFMDKI